MARWDGRRLRIDDLLDSGWSAELAWILGVVYGDGHVSKYSVQTTGGGTTDEDALVGCQLLDRWRLLVDPNVEVLPRKGREGRTWDVVVYSKRFADWLRGLGIKSNKSRTLTWPEVLPGEFVCDFLRGVWDTDGWCTLKVRATEHSPRKAPQLVVGISMAAQELIEAIPLKAAAFSKVLVVENTRAEGRPYAGYKYWGFEYVARNALELASYLYADAPEGMRHEKKWQSYETYRKRLEDGCEACGGSLYRLGWCKQHFVESTWPVQAKDITCTVCGKVGTIALGLCVEHYGQQNRPKALAKGRACIQCGKAVPYNGLCARCSSEQYREQIAKDEPFGKCHHCGVDPVFIRKSGECRKCYDKRQYREKKSKR